MSSVSSPDPLTIYISLMTCKNYFVLKGKMEKVFFRESFTVSCWLKKVKLLERKREQKGLNFWPWKRRPIWKNANLFFYNESYSMTLDNSRR